MRTRVTGVVLALAAMTAVALAATPAPALQRDEAEPALAIVEPERGVTFTSDGGFVDVPVVLEVAGVSPGEELNTPTGKIYLFLYSQAVFEEVVTNESAPTPGLNLPGANESIEAVPVEGGNVEAYLLLRGGNYAVLETPFVTIRDVPEGEWVVLAQLVPPTGQATEAERALVPFTVEDADRDALPTLFPNDLGVEEEDTGVVDDSEAGEGEDVVDGDEAVDAGEAEPAGPPEENERVGEPVLGPDDAVEGPVTPGGSPLVALVIGVAAFVAVGVAGLLATRWRGGR